MKNYSNISILYYYIYICEICIFGKKKLLNLVLFFLFEELIKSYKQFVVFLVFDIVIVVNIFKSIGYLFFYYVCYYFQFFYFLMF